MRREIPVTGNVVLEKLVMKSDIRFSDDIVLFCRKNQRHQRNIFVCVEGNLNSKSHLISLDMGSNPCFLLYDSMRSEHRQIR